MVGVPPTIDRVMDPLYTADGDRFVPSEHTRGPWDPRHQHGGAPAALLARAVEAPSAKFGLLATATVARRPNFETASESHRYVAGSGMPQDSP